MSLLERYNRLCCRLFGHRWSEWTLVSDNDTLPGDEYRYCLYCFTTDTRMTGRPFATSVRT